MTGLLSDNPDVMAALLRAICDPGSITPRAPLESVASWQRRAIVEHAAPLIAAQAAAAERARIRQLAIEHNALLGKSEPDEHGDYHAVPFADLLEPSP